jgi:hypothetical protein
MREPRLKTEWWYMYQTWADRYEIAFTAKENVSRALINLRNKDVLQYHRALQQDINQQVTTTTTNPMTFAIG